MVSLPTPPTPTVSAIYAAYEAAADHGYREHLARIIHDPLRVVDFLPPFSAETNS
jgi:hypothetical protein